VNIVVAGGGTAGHIEPALNLADEIRRRYPDASITVLGTVRGLEVTLVPSRGYELTLIPPVPMPRRINKDLLTLPWRLWTSIRATRVVLANVDADVVIGFGGYVAIPAYLAARGRVPIVVHEANVKPGIANRVGAFFAAAVAESVKGSMKNAVHTGLPIRSTIRDLSRDALRSKALTYFGVDGDRPIVLCFGGSQGAVKLNAGIRESRDRGVLSSVTLIHAVGGKNEVPAGDGTKYRPLAYIDRMDYAYAIADFVIARSGAMTVAEISSVGIAACFVPLPIGNGEQALNASPLVEHGGAIQVTDAQFNVEFVRDEVIPLVVSPARRNLMAERSRAFGHSNAAAELANLVEHVVQGDN